MKRSFLLFAVFSLLLSLTTGRAQQLVVYDNIPGRDASDQYVCKVKFSNEENSAFRDAFVLQTTCKTDAGYYDNLYGWSASWIAFESDFNGDNVVVEISKKDGSPITKAMVRPVAEAQAATITNGKAYVTLDRPANINVDIDGQMEDQYTGQGYSGDPVHTISIFANPVYQVPDITDPEVIELNPGDAIPSDRNSWHTIYFKPGVHEIGKNFEIFSNETLYIPGNAVVHGTIHPPDLWGASSAHNIKVYGSGAISGENYTWIGDGSKETKTFTYQAASAHLEGFVVIDPANHTFNMNCSYNDPQYLNTYKNLKIFGWRQNSDAINAFRHSVITDCFFRVQDDVFYYGENVKISNITTWNDANGAVLFLTKGSSVMEDSYFKDITSIYHRAKWHYWDGGRIISMRDTRPGRTIENVSIQNVLVEDPYPAFPPFYATMVSDTGDVTLNNIVIENVHQEHNGVSSNIDENQGGKPQNTLLGLDNNRKWKNITFKNCYFNGKDLGSFEDGNFLINEFVDTTTVVFRLDNNTSLNDTITGIIAPDQVSPGDTVTVSVSYGVAGNRDLVVFIQQNASPWHQYGSTTLPVGEGTATTNVDLVVSDTIPIKTDAYKIVANLRDVGGSWPGYDEKIKDNVDAVSNCNDDLPWNDSDFSVSNNVMNYSSGLIDISCTSSATISLDIEGIVRKTSGSDYCNVYYKVDGGPQQLISGNTGAFDLKTVSISGIVGDDLEIIINTSSGHARNNYAVSNLSVTADSLKSMTSSATSFEKEIKGSDVLKLYPNPAHNLLNIDFRDSIERTINVFNMGGRLLYRTETNEKRIQIDLQALNVHDPVLIQVKSGSSESNHKIMVR